MKSKTSYIIWIIGAFCALSFYQKKDSTRTSLDEESNIPPIVAEYLKERLDSYMATRKKNCIKEILEDAEAHVDSTIINEINIHVLDTLIFPEKPIKPPYPGKIILDDTTKIAPVSRQ